MGLAMGGDQWEGMLMGRGTGRDDEGTKQWGGGEGIDGCKHKWS